MIFIPGNDWTPPGVETYQPAWASIAGSDSTFWWEPGQSYYRDRSPEVGVEAAITYDGVASQQPAWLRYETVWGHDNGEWRAVEEIERVAVILGTVRPAAPGGSSPHVVTPSHIYTLPDLFALDPHPVHENFWEDSFGRVFATCLDSRVWRLSVGPYRYWSYNLEGDVGMWLIGREHGSAMSALMCGQWTHGERFFYAGHRTLTSEETARLA